MTLTEALKIIEEVEAVFRQDGVLPDLIQMRERDCGTPTIESAIEIEDQTRLAVSQACLDYSHTEKWRALPAEQQLLIYERLFEARAFLSLFEHATEVGDLAPILISPTTDRHTLVAFLLNDYWGLCGQQKWIARLRRPRKK
jgi:hypothetical protein